MVRTFGVIALLTLVGFVAGEARSGSAQTTPAWPTFHGNAQRAGSTVSAGPQANTVVNQWQPPKGVESSPAVDTNGVAYVGDDDGSMYALDPTEPNAPRWSFATSGKVVSSPTLSGDGKTIYVGSDDGSVYAISTTTGGKLWSVDLGGEVRASPLLTADGSTIIVTNVNGNIRALATADGSKVWGPINLGTAVDGSLTLSPDGSTFYVAGYASVMYAIPATGANAGKQVTTTFYLTGPAIATPAIDGNGNIYVTTLNGTLDSFSPGSGNERTGFPYVASDHTASVSTPAIGTGIVVFGDNNGNLYDVSPSSGQPVWNSFPHTGAAIGSSPAIASNGVVYVGSDDGYVYAFSTATGQPLWQKSTGGAMSSSPAIGSDSALWVASQSGVVYRIWQSGLSPSLTPTSTSTSTPNNTPTPTPTSVPTSTATPTLMPTDTPTPTPTSVATASISLSPSTVTAGAPTTISVTGAGFAPGETVWVGYTAILNGGGTASEQTTATARGDGTFLANALAVPGDIYPAPHQIKALGQSSGRTATAVLNVRAASPAGTPVTFSSTRTGLSSSCTTASEYGLGRSGTGIRTVVREGSRGLESDMAHAGQLGGVNVREGAAAIRRMREVVGDDVDANPRLAGRRGGDRPDAGDGLADERGAGLEQALDRRGLGTRLVIASQKTPTEVFQF